VVDQRQIFAFSGMLEAAGDRRSNFDLTLHALTLSGKENGQRLCYLPTAVGDSPVAVHAKANEFGERRSDVDFSVLTLFTQPNVDDIRRHLLSQDVIFVEGGSVANLLAVWAVHGLPSLLKECWEEGVVLAGVSAGSLCWHTGGPTDSFGDSLRPFTNGLGFLPFSNGVHDDFTDQPRRRTYRQLVATGEIDAGYATEDGVGLHYRGTSLSEAVTVRPGSCAWRVDPDAAGGYTEEPVKARPL